MKQTIRLEQFERADIRSALAKMNRGIERESLRITSEGQLATTMHPAALGATLTHPLITTDYAEALMEFITPVSTSITTTLAQLRDVHRFTYQHIGDEYLWPLSMPCYLNATSDIRLAQFGKSHVGRMKTVYRQGLTHRYGAVMQTISGVHFNWSVSDELWPLLAAEEGRENNADYRSERYFGLIRNFKRWAWVIPYLFGASPVLCKSFLKHSSADLDFHELSSGMVYVPHSTSLRMSDLGYTNKEQAALKITYNSLDDYVDGLRRAVFTRSEQFADIGVQTGDKWQQLNANILQIENEFYSPIRPKRVADSGETPTQALERGGIQYIEVRALDVNPFSEVGITAEQMRFLDLFLLFCLFTESPELSIECQQATEKNVNKVVLRGREPGLTLMDEAGEYSVQERLAHLFAEMAKIADVLEAESSAYHRALQSFAPAISNPDATFSAKLLRMYEEASKIFQHVGMRFAVEYRDRLKNSGYEFYTEADFQKMAAQSLAEQAEIEAQDKGSFGDFLAAYFEQALDKKKRA
ncbi:glutamate--cysteine ligase [Aliidiomarina iranensis]|uniref:Glutamate--cysteine ligase n=1 Tax=Aliidiomarina iranensis TaxID=1434071 RepID=A0A432VSD3_9GAMM|nr:glutamate--cysteine ligase [Aliidiomarina iranensis]RUO19269.1 glutamate--cysteine ligase [Aliidiomarina iranensis]